MDIVSYLMGKKSGGGSPVPEYEGAYTVTPSEQTQTLATNGKQMMDDVTVNPIPSSYVQPTGTKQITQNGMGIDVSSFATADVLVEGSGDKNEYVFSGYFKASVFKTYNVNFVSNGVLYDSLRVKSNTEIYYGKNGTEVRVYRSGNAFGYRWTPATARRIKILGGEDSEDQDLLALLHPVWDWIEPSSYSNDSIYLYLDIPYDDFPITISAYKMSGGTNRYGSVNWGDWSDSVNSEIYPASSSIPVPNHTYLKGKYIITITDSDKLLAKLKVNSSNNTNLLCGTNYGALALKKIRLPQDGSLFVPDAGLSSYGINIRLFYYAELLNTVYNMIEYGEHEFSYTMIETAELVYQYPTVGASAFEWCRNLRLVRIPDGITTIGDRAFYGDINLQEIHFASSTPPTISGSNSFTSVPTTCKIYIPYASLASYLIATNYPSPSTYTYIGFATYESGATLPTQDTTEAYNVVWYATKADAIAQTNPITVGNGSEIYCRYTAV